MYIRYTVCVCIFICLQGFCYAVFLEIQFKQTRCTEWSDVELSIWVSESELSRAAGTDWVCFAYAIIVLCLSAVCMGKAGVSVFRCVCILDILCVCVCEQVGVDVSVSVILRPLPGTDWNKVTWAKGEKMTSRPHLWRWPRTEQMQRDAPSFLRIVHNNPWWQVFFHF